MIWIGMLLAIVATPMARAQGGPPPGGEGGAEGTIAVSVVFPPETDDVRMVATIGEMGSSSLFTNDGSFAMDLHGDGEWWAVLNPVPGTNVLRIAGRADGHRVWHTEDFRVPAAWMSKSYPVTFLAQPGEASWTLTRTLTGGMPKMTQPTVVGMGGRAEEVGLPVSVLYLGWGGLILVLVSVAGVRGAILSERRLGGSV